MIRAFYILALLALVAPALAQHNHAQHHASYQSWVNKADKGCCDNQDCRDLAEDGERIEGGRLVVRVDGEWCPVLPHHYLKRGNVPDASVSHACIVPRDSPRASGLSACERLLCYQPRPGI
jgi:hypothetical protein